MFLRTHEIKVGEIYIDVDGRKQKVVKSYQGEYPVFESPSGDRKLAGAVDIEKRIHPPESANDAPELVIEEDAIERIYTLAAAVDRLASAYSKTPRVATKEAQDEVSELIVLIAGREIDRNE